jgi:hypothetical protein
MHRNLLIARGSSEQARTAQAGLPVLFRRAIEPSGRAFAITDSMTAAL